MSTNAQTRKQAWSLLISIEPACAALLDEARSEYRALQARYRRIPYQRLLETFYGSFKPRLSKLAGYGARNPLLRSPAIYDLLYEAIGEALHIDCSRENPSKALEKLEGLARRHL